VYLAYYGKVGLPNLAKKIMGLTQYAKKQIAEKTKCEILHRDVPHFHELAIKCPSTAVEVNEMLLEDGLIGGLALERWGDPAEHMLLGFSDENTVEQVDALVDVLSRQ